MGVLGFAIVGLASGAIIALAALSLVITFRSSGILNFALGAFVIVGGYAYYSLRQADIVGVWGAVGLAVLIAALAGTLTYWGIIRPLVAASPLTRVIATLAVLTAAQALAGLVYGSEFRTVPSALPTQPVKILATSVGLDRLIILTIGCVLGAGLGAIYRYTGFGRVTSAVAENVRYTASLGHSPDRVAVLNWTMGAAVSGLAGVLLAPITVLTPSGLSDILIPALAAALIGSFSSFLLGVLGALGIGAMEGILIYYTASPVWPDVVPFLLVIAILVFRGRALPLRSYLFDRLPPVGSGRIRPVPTVIAAVTASVIVLYLLPTEWTNALAPTFAVGIICLSVVLLTGYAGQLSLAQFVLAGVGATIAGELSLHMPFLLALACAVGITAAVGAAVGIPSLRTRGAVLAIVTLGLGDAVFEAVLSNNRYDGGDSGITVNPPSVFGWHVDPLLHSNRYAFICLVALVLVSIAVANIRRGSVGLRLVAVRSNERAAAAMGVNVYTNKIYAFAVASGIAALGGALLGFTQFAVLPNQYTTSDSLSVVLASVVGGVGFVGGALPAALLLPGTALDQLINFNDLDLYLPLVSAVLVLIVIRTQPQGVFEVNRALVAKTWARITRRPQQRQAGGAVAGAYSRGDNSRALPDLHIARQTLRVEHLSVRFGGVSALDDVSLEVLPGRIHGLIGPNGAGKTTLIDAVTGFVPLTSGKVRLDDRDITRSAPAARTRSGIARTFQSLELFNDLTVLENLAVASDERARRRYVMDLVHPGRTPLSHAALALIDACDLGRDLGKKPAELPHGRQRLVALARSLALVPSTLLLDEPAAGLDDEETAELGRLLRRLADAWDIGMLLVEHRMDLVMSICDEVTVLQTGKLLTRGTPETVRSDERVLEAYLGTR